MINDDIKAGGYLLEYLHRGRITIGPGFTSILGRKPEEIQKAAETERPRMPRSRSLKSVCVEHISYKSMYGKIHELLDGRLPICGRVMEMLSEHTCEGWLEGYILSGRHGLLNSYEPFIRIIDSMVNQHCK
jgi:phosphoketolase